MAFGVIACTCGAAGAWTVRTLELRGTEYVLFSFLSGFAWVAIGVSAIGSFSLRIAEVFVFAVLAFGLSYCLWWYLSGRGKGRVGKALPESVSGFEWLCIATILAASGLALLHALAPNTNWDAGVAHLALPSDYARQGTLAFLEGNVYSAYPHLLHSLYTFTYHESGERSTALLNWFFGPLGCLSLYVLGKRAADRKCGLIGAALFATAPIYFDQVGTVSIDVPFAAMAMGSLSCLYAWSEERRAGWLVLASFLAGSSCGIRHTGYLVCALMVLGVFFLPERRRFLSTALFAGTAFLGAVPWLLRSALAVGNPMYPFMRSVFPSDRLPDVQTTVPLRHESIQGTGLLDFLLFPLDIIMRPEHYDGWSASPGGVVLFLGIPGLIIGGTRIRVLGGFALSGVASFYFFQRFARYLLPFMTPMMVAAGVTANRLPRLRTAIQVLLAFSFVYGLALGVATVYFKAPVALGLESREAYLARRVERYDAFAWVNDNLPKNAVVMTFDPRSYFIDRPTFQNFEVLESLRPLSIEEQMDWFAERNISYIFYPEAYILESPMYATRGFTLDLERWRSDPQHFVLVESLELSRPGGTERVEIYRIRYDGGPEDLINSPI